MDAMEIRARERYEQETDAGLGRPVASAGTTSDARLTHRRPMSKKHPDFTDVVYADARAREHARKGLRLSEKGDKKGARAAYQEALRWSKEAERLEKIVRPQKPADRTSARARRRP